MRGYKLARKVLTLMPNFMISLFKPKPLIEQASADWIFDAFEWALSSFDSKEFFERSRLIQPTNEFFPGRVDSVHAKAENIFRHTLDYAGLAHWPFQLVRPEHYQALPPPPLPALSLERNSTNSGLPALACDTPLTISYNPQQTLKPEDLSSTFAHMMAQHIVVQAQNFPPGGTEYFFEGTEILAIFMGFGVMFANSAYTFRGGCGSCYNAQANRQASLSEDEVVFALALYSRLKQIPTPEATRYLKKHLKSAFKSALKQIDAESYRLYALMKLAPR